MKKQIWYVILGTMLWMWATMALNLNMDISNLVAYFKQIVLTDNGTSSGTPTITFNGSDGKIQGAEMDIDVKNGKIQGSELNMDLVNGTLENGNNKLDLKNGKLEWADATIDLKNGSIVGSKVNIDLKNGDMYVGWMDTNHKVVIKSELDTVKNDIDDIKNNYATKSYVDSKATNRFNKIYLNWKCYVSDSNSVSCNNADMVWCEDLKNHQICTYDSNKTYDLDAWAASSFSSYLKDTRKSTNELYNYWLISHPNYNWCTLDYVRIGKRWRRPWIWWRHKSCIYSDGDTRCSYWKIAAWRNWSNCNTSSANCNDWKYVWDRHIHFVVTCTRFYWN